MFANPPSFFLGFEVYFGHILMRRNKKKVIALSVLFLCIGLCLFFVPDISFAQSKTVAVETGSGGLFGDFIAGLKTFINWVLYKVIFTPITWLASGAIALFEFAVNPDYLSGPSGLLNRSVVYELWKFIRDFFNLFFIFSLLLVAFSTVFQIEKYSIKKMLLSVVLAALFVNFSFPIARFLIDVSNVPMYFFAKQMMNASSGATSASGALEKGALSSTRMEKILLPIRNADDSVNYGDTNISQLFLAIVFMFLFSISLAVLAVMFVIRLTALIVLVIFSPIGFVGAAVPLDAISKYSKEWWDKFNQYLIFGPVAMLMLLVTVRFMSVISEDAFYKQAESIAQGSGADALAKQMILFSIPMIMIWMTISISSKMGIAGAKTVEGWGLKARGWGKGLALGVGRGMASPVTTRAKGLGSGLKERAEKTKGVKLFTPKYWSDRTKEKEEEYKAKFAGRSDSYVRDKHTKAVSESEKKFDDARKSDNDLRKVIDDYNVNPKSQSAEDVEAAVRMLSKRDGFRDVAELNSAITALDRANGGAATAQSAEKRAELIRKADKSLFKDMNDLTSALGHLGNDAKSAAQLIEKVDAGALKGSGAQYTSLISSGALSGNAELQAKLNGRIKKEGHLKTLIDYDIGLGMGRQAAYDKHLSGLTAAEVGKVKGIHGDAATPVDAELRSFVQDQVTSGNWTPQEHIDAYKNLNSQQKVAWRGAGLKP